MGPGFGLFPSACHSNGCIGILFLTKFASIPSSFILVQLTLLTMKFTALLLVTLTKASNAFSPIMESKTGTKLFVLPPSDPVDKTMRGIDTDDSTFDPTGGENPALARNNKGEVWNKQVSIKHTICRICSFYTKAFCDIDRSVYFSPYSFTYFSSKRARPRRNRKSAAVRSMVRECMVTPSNFIYPLFIHDEDFNTPIASMPGCERHSLTSMLNEVTEAFAEGVKTFVLFPKVPDELKTNLGVEAYNPKGIVPRAIQMIKEKFPESVVCTDVALDPYSNQGHDGIVEDGKIINDATIHQLCKQAVCQARAGADIVAPSDMMVRSHTNRNAGILSVRENKPNPLCSRMVESRLFAMLLIQRALRMYPFSHTLPSTLLHTMGHFVMHWIATQDSVTRKHTNKTLPMDAKP